ncbi:MAG: hypothetical protein ACRDZ0_14280 [Acidimicrobiales bacterium]
MQLWSPPHDRPHLFEWWRPLLLASQQARRRRVPWLIHLDEFSLAGRVVRDGRPDVWIYEHHANRGSLCIDATGTTYRFIPTPMAKGVGQFRPCDIRSAVWRAGLPEVVEPVRYREPPAGADAEAWQSGTERPDDDVELREASGGAAATGHGVRRGHLTVIDGGG